VTKSLKAMVSNPDNPLEKYKKFHEVSKDIMKELFFNNTSEEILEASEEVMDIMGDCMNKAEAWSHDIGHHL
jgi:hypothetical protein